MVSSLMRGPERTGSVDVGLLVVDRVRSDRRGAELVHHSLHLLGSDVGDDETHALAVQIAAEMVGDVAGTLHRHRLPRQAVAAPAGLRRGLHAHVHAVGGHRRRIARKAEEPGHMVGLQLDVFHVRGRGADVLGGDVASVERLDEAAVGPEERLPVLPPVVADDDRLPAAEVDAGHGGLVGHPPGEPQRVGDGLIGVLVLPEAGAAQRRAEGGVVDRDDPVIAARRIVGQEELLVSERAHGVEDVHRITPSLCRCRSCRTRGPSSGRAVPPPPSAGAGDKPGTCRRRGRDGARRGSRDTRPVR